MLHRKVIVFCSEVRTKHINKAELYYRLSAYCAVNTPRQGFKLSNLMLYGERIAVYSEIHTKHVNKAESYYRLRSYRADDCSLYLRLLTSSGGLWNSNFLIVVLPCGSGPWNSKGYIRLHYWILYRYHESIRHVIIEWVTQLLQYCDTEMLYCYVTCSFIWITAYNCSCIPTLPHLKHWNFVVVLYYLHSRLILYTYIYRNSINIVRPKMSTVTTFKVCDYTRNRFHRPVYLHLLTSTGHLWNSVLIVLVAIHGTSCQTKQTLLKFILECSVFMERFIASEWNSILLAISDTICVCN
jgi:hypothetical protein